MSVSDFQPGDTVSFRLPKDTPSYLIDMLNERREALGRHFAKRNAELFLDAVSNEPVRINPSGRLTIPLPDLNEEQLNWLQDRRTKALLSQWIYELTKNPVATPPTQSDLSPPASKAAAENTKEKENEPSFKANPLAAQFAKKTFIDNEDEDE